MGPFIIYFLYIPINSRSTTYGGLYVIVCGHEQDNDGQDELADRAKRESLKKVINQMLVTSSPFVQQNAPDDRAGNSEARGSPHQAPSQGTSNRNLV